MNRNLYLAAPLFTCAEMEFNKALKDRIFHGTRFDVILPQEECKGIKDKKEIYDRNVVGVQKSRIVVAILDGADSDSGTSFECGIAVSNEIPIIGLRTDFRGTGDDGGLNLMLSQSCSIVVNNRDLLINTLIEIQDHDEYNHVLDERLKDFKL